MTGDVASVTSLAPTEDTTYAYDGPRGTTSELGGITPSNSSSVESTVFSFLIALCVAGFVANLAMLVGLLMQRRTSARKTVNIFICNQKVLDLVTTFISIVYLAVVMSGYLKTKTGVLTMLLIH